MTPTTDTNEPGYRRTARDRRTGQAHARDGTGHHVRILPAGGHDRAGAREADHHPQSLRSGPPTYCSRSDPAPGSRGAKVRRATIWARATFRLPTSDNDNDNIDYRG